MPRNSAKAVIIRDEQLLVIVKRDTEGEYFILPGGGQEPFESLSDALRRECLEEIGVAVEISDLLYVRDCIAKNHGFAASEPDVHQVELMFACRVPEGYAARLGAVPDIDQEGVTWLPLKTLEATRLYPATWPARSATRSWTGARACSSRRPTRWCSSFWPRVGT
jgi:ADP-ribose pyrophosphatase YjhB (NUDIX family)